MISQVMMHHRSTALRAILFIILMSCVYPQKFIAATTENARVAFDPSTLLKDTESDFLIDMEKFLQQATILRSNLESSR